MSCSFRTRTILLGFNEQQDHRSVMACFVLSPPATAQSPGELRPEKRKADDISLPADQALLPALGLIIIQPIVKILLFISRKIFNNNNPPVNPLRGYLFRRLLLPPALRYSWGVWRSLPYILAGVRALLKKRLTVPLLDASALLAALLRADWASVSTVTFLFSLGEYLEYSTHKKSRQNLAHGLSLLENSVCWLVKDGVEIQALLTSLVSGDILVLRAGQEVPVDGVIVEGEAMINQSSLTGESMPQHRRSGAWLYAGTALEEGQVYIRVVNTHGQTRISRIINYIDQAEALKAKIEMQAANRADALVPYNFAGAALVALVTRDSQKVASVLMVDYSCAIRLSTPLSILSAMRSGVEQGVLIKGGKFLEALALADTVIFDKTGTLTTATPRVAQVLSFSSVSSLEILRMAACLEEHFPHPLGKAVVEHANLMNLKHREEHAAVEYITAHGIVSRLNNKRLLLGSAHFITEDEGITPHDKIIPLVQQQADLGRSLLYLAMDGRIAGLLALEDPPRREAREVITALRRDGLDVHMLTGDGPEAAQAMAGCLGIENFAASMLPSDKSSYVQKLKEQGRRIMMIGDGINDSPALAIADVGITLQDGSDLARNVADVVLSRNNLHDIVTARRLAKQALNRINYNYIGIVGINTLLLGLGIAGVITPTSSALLHNTSTIVSALNSMRSFTIANRHPLPSQ
ncbi:MAG: heavy metal translocating P-type ATPase [Desulfarculales bacterium]|nr:heavy metal translocating P-type ATPase [Desulfarculales bacterium]